MRARALDNFVPLAVSLCGRGSVIIDSDGSILAQARPGLEDFIVATIDLDGTPVDHSQWEIFTGTADLKARYLQERRPETYGSLTAPCPPVLNRYDEDGKQLAEPPSRTTAQRAGEHVQQRGKHGGKTFQLKHDVSMTSFRRKSNVRN